MAGVSEKTAQQKGYPTMSARDHNLHPFDGTPLGAAAAKTLSTTEFRRSAALVVDPV